MDFRNFSCITSQENAKVTGAIISCHTFVMLLPYRVKISDTKVTHFTPILPLCTNWCAHVYIDQIYRNQYRWKKTQQKLRGSKFIFKMSTIHANTCIQTTTPLRNRWWLRWQCPVLVLRAALLGTRCVNGDTVLLNMLLPDIRSVFGDYYLFQHDGHRHIVHLTLSPCCRERETPEFIPLEMWPLNKPDLNPVDYSIYDVLLERVYRSWIHDVKELKERLLREWRLLDHTVIAAAIAQWRSRLDACVRVNGGHFEHNFWTSYLLLCFVCFIDTGFCKCDRYRMGKVLILVRGGSRNLR